jgi:aspartyl-tRNA(Asn)/glutamyl-tRNA(Gln) amidotransferase subunit C
MPAISRDDVAHLARLARLELTDAELEHYAAQLDVILGAVARVSEVAADDVEPMSHPVAISNVFRPDRQVPGLTPRAGAVRRPGGRGRTLPRAADPG